MADPLVFHYKDLSNTIKLTWAQMNQNLRSIEDGVTIVQDAEFNTTQLENSTSLLRDQAQTSATLASSKADAASDSAATAADEASAASDSATTATAKAGEANQSALDAAQSAADADQSATDAAQSADDAQAQAESIETAVDPTPNKIPMADDSGTIKQGWVNGLEYAVDALQTAKNQVRYGDGPYPVLDMNFIGAGMIDPRANFSRASATWDFDQNGNYRKFEINEPAIAYDPVTGEAKGLQQYPQRTNLFPHSKNMPLLNGSSVLSGGELESVGGKSFLSTGVKMTAENETSYYYSNVLLTEGEQYAFSFFASREDGLEPLMGGANTSHDISPVGMGINHSLYASEYVGDGVWRLSFILIFTIGFSHTGIIKRQTHSDNPVTVYGYQLEKGTRPTPYIPTNGSQVTVAATNLQIDGDLFDEIYNPKQGTMVFDVGENYFKSSSNITPYVNYGLLGVNSSNLTGSLGATGYSLVIWGSSGTNVPPTLNMPTGYRLTNHLGLPYTLGMAYTSSFQSIAAYGEVASSSRDASDFLENSASRIFLSPLNSGYIKSIQYYNRALTETQLEEIASNE